MKQRLKILLESPHRRYLILFILLFSLYHIPATISSSVTPLLKNLVLNQAGRAGIDLQFSAFNFHFPYRVHMKNVLIKSQSAPSFHLDMLDFRLKKILSGTSVQTTLNLYDGSLTCDLGSRKIIPTFPYDTQCMIENIKIDRYPLAYGLGLAGEISGVVNGMLQESIHSSRFNFNIQLGSASFNAEQNPMTKMLKLPNISSIEVQLQGDLLNDQMNIENGTIFSSHGSITSIKGVVSNITQARPAISLEGILQLSDQGKESLSTWLELLNNNRPLPQGQNRVKIEGSMPSPRLQFLPLQ